MSKQKKTWVKAETWVTEAMLDVAQSAFLDAGAIGIEVDDGLGPEGQRKYPADHILVKAYFEPSDCDREAITAHVNRFFGECGFAAATVNFANFLEEDWQGNFVKSCTTFMVAPDIYIVPSFEIEDFKKNDGKLYIEMDPENAFGTGQHQTTKLCLTQIRALMGERAAAAAHLQCLDVGCGSGILAILLKKLGAGSVVATEIDGDALITCEKNAQKNGVTLTTELVSEQHRYEAARYDVVVANIFAHVLIDMAENLSKALRPLGDLIVSGILVSQADGVVAAYEKQGLTLVKQDKMDDWCVMVFHRNY